MHRWLVALNNRQLGDASLTTAEGEASPGDLVRVTLHGRKLKGIVLKETDTRTSHTFEILESNYAPSWLIWQCLQVLEEYPINCFELLELGKNWKERPRTFIQLKAFNYVPVGTKEKELVKLLREKPLELTNAVMRKFKVQIESFLSLGIVEKVVVPPTSYALTYARLEKPSLFVPNHLYEKFAHRPLPLIFWKKLLGHWTVEKLKEEEALVLELHVLSSMKLPVDRNMPRQEKPPTTLEELPPYLRNLLEKGEKTLLVFPSLQMARGFAREILKHKLPAILDSGGYTRFLQEACSSKGGGLIIGTPRSVLRPWNNLMHIITVFEKPEDLAIRTASQRLPLSKFIPKDTQVHTVYPQPTTKVQLVSMAGRKDVEVLAYIKGVHDPTKRQLFLVNRLGFSTSVQCKNCGYILTCPECGTPLRYHRRSKRLECHRCGYIASIPDKCPRCESLSLEPSGLGIERLELQLGKKALRSVKDLDHNTVISTTKVFRYLPKGTFDESYYISPDADLSSPVLIPEKKFLRNINYLKVWTKTEGYVFVLSRDIERLKSLINEGESIITENVKQMGLPPFGHYIELESSEQQLSFIDAVVWGPVYYPRKKTYKYFLISANSPKAVLKEALTKISFVSFDTF